MDEITFSEKTVRRYYANRFAPKMFYTWFLLFIPAPFFCIGAVRYKKAFLVFPIIFVVGLALFVVWAANWWTPAMDANPDRDMFMLATFTPGMALMFGAYIPAFICMCVLSSKPDKQIKAVVDEVYAGEGKAAKKNFVKTLCAKSKAKDVDGFTREINAAHARYEARKDIILTRKQAEVRINRAVVSCTLTEDKVKAKELKKRLEKMYVERRFEELHAELDEYDAKMNEYKAELVKSESAEKFEIEYDGKSMFDGTLLQRIGWTLLCNLVTVVSLGLAFPATLCWKMRWQAKHTVYNGKRLSFDGTGMQLLGKWICWCLLTVVTFGIYGFFVAKKVEAWKAKHTHIAGEFKAIGGTFDGGAWALFGYRLLGGFLSLITLGLAVPAAICMRERYIYRHRVYDGRRLSFDGTGAGLFGSYIKWFLLSVVTLGIYSLWIPNRILKWQAEHTTLSEETECVL